MTALDVDLNLGVLKSAIFPIRFSSDWVGVPGQSGSLVIESQTGEPTGSYLGVLHPAGTPYTHTAGTAPPPTVGYVQTCYQLEAAADLEFFL